MRTLPLRLLVLLFVVAASAPAVALAQDSGGGELVSWRLGIPAAVLATVVGLARWIKGRLSDGSLTITATSKAAKALTEEKGDLVRECAILTKENEQLKSELEDARDQLRTELEDAKQSFRDQLAKMEEREMRWMDIALSSRSGDHDTTD